MVSSEINIKILDSKREMIAFILDFNEDIYREDMFSSDTENKSNKDRYGVIMSEISNFTKFKKFISNNNDEFCLYIYNTKLIKMIDFCSDDSFINQFEEIKKYKLNNLKNFEKCVLNINDLYVEALKLLSNINSETILRFILIYNRPSIPKIDQSQITTYDLIKYTNFYCDLILLRRKITKDEEKKICNSIYEALNTLRPKSWYSFEMSGNVQKFKHCLNLLLAHPLQRIKIIDVEKYHKNIDNLFRNFIE